MIQRNQWMGGRPAGLRQGIRMSTQAIVVRPGASTTIPRPTVYEDFFTPTLQPQNNPQAPACEPGTPGCLL